MNDETNSFSGFRDQLSALVLVCCWVFGPAAARAEDLQVNLATAEGEEYSALAVNAAGEVVILWLSEQDKSIQGRLYAADGGLRGDQLQINTELQEDERMPDVAINAGGEFVVAWERVIGFDGIAIEYQRFAADGTKIGEQLMASCCENRWASYPAVAMDDEGNFVLVWSETPDGDDYVIRARRFDATLGELGEAFSVSLLKGSFEGHWRPSVAMTASGNRFVVAWRARIPNDPNGYEILARRFSGDGRPLGEPFQVNSLAAGEQSNPMVGIDGAGNFAIAWQSESSLGSDQQGQSIQVRRFASDGAALGPQVQANTYTPSDQRAPDLAMTQTGEFVVSWYSYGSPAHGAKVDSLQVQRFRADGSFAGEPVDVNATPEAYPVRGRVGIDAEGSFVASWWIRGSLGTDPRGVVVRSRSTGWNQLFGDGFESGTAESWSSVQP